MPKKLDPIEEFVMNHREDDILDGEDFSDIAEIDGIDFDEE